MVFSSANRVSGHDFQRAAPFNSAPSIIWIIPTAFVAGGMVYCLPMYHPIRLLEEVCVLDQMSGVASIARI
jgi:hypothetical protein